LFFHLRRGRSPPGVRRYPFLNDWCCFFLATIFLPVGRVLRLRLFGPSYPIVIRLKSAHGRSDFQSLSLFLFFGLASWLLIEIRPFSPPPLWCVSRPAPQGFYFGLRSLFFFFSYLLCIISYHRLAMFFPTQLFFILAHPPCSSPASNGSHVTFLSKDSCFFFGAHFPSLVPFPCLLSSARRSFLMFYLPFLPSDGNLVGSPPLSF